MAADELTRFESLLQNLMSPENQVRTFAEETYDTVPVVNKVPFLLQMLKKEDAALETRSMAAVLLRRLYTSSFEEFWPQLSPESQASVKQEMLQCVQHEQQPSVRRKVCECTAELARNMLDDDGNMLWPEVLKFLFDCASSQDVSLRESALHIFSVVPGVFGAQQTQYLEVIRQMLEQSLGEPNHAGVRFAAARATVAFLLANEGQGEVLSGLRPLLPGILAAVAQSAEAQDDDALLKCLVDLAENTPKYLRPQLEAVFSLCLKLVSDGENTADQWRQLALEVIVTLAETAPAMVRKVGAKFLGLLVPQVLGLMVDLEEDEAWAMADETEEEDSDSNAIAGESALDRLSCGLGGKTMLPHILANVPPMLAHADWRHRHAALMAISACGEGCHRQMEQLLANIVDAILPFLQDPHPRVRYAACNAVGQMSTDFGPAFQKRFHERVVGGLLQALEDLAHPRVAAHAGAALVNFSEDCPKSILAPYLPTILERLERVLSAQISALTGEGGGGGSKLVLEQAVTTLAAVADTAEEKFTAHYDRFMPCLKFIVQNACSPELRLLRGKTIECISLIGLAVGSEKFMSDCSEVMELLLKTQTDWEDLPEDDPQLSYMISAWARMCKIMGKAFEQYLPLVMGPVLKAAAVKPEVALVDSDEMKDMEGDADWEFVTLGDQQSFGIRTSGLEEKATACQMLVCYARELKEGFAAYTEDVVKIMVQHLKFYFHDGVRLAAAESLPYLLDCAKMRGAAYLSTMWQFICPELLKAVATEPEAELKSEHMHSLAQCIQRMGRGCLTTEQTQELTRTLDRTLTEHFERQAARLAQRADEDYDEVVEEALEDEDEQDVYVLSKVSDVMHALFGTHKEAALPLFDQLLPHFTKLIGTDRPWPDKQWAVCVFDDLVEHTGPLSQNYSQHFIAPLVQHLADSHWEVRQAAAYGVGVLAQFGGPGYASVCAEALPYLVKMVQAPDARNMENLSATENAISAVAKICKFNPSSVRCEEVLPHWLSWLPVWDDEEEAVHIYGFLCDLIEGNSVHILGESNSNLPRVMSILADCFKREVLDTDADVYKRMVNIVRQIQSNGEVFQACVSPLDPESQAALSAAISS